MGEMADDYDMYYDNDDWVEYYNGFEEDIFDARMHRDDRPPVEIKILEVSRETPYARLVVTKNFDWWWLPKSQCSFDEKTMVMEIPAWLWDKKMEESGAKNFFKVIGGRLMRRGTAMTTLTLKWESGKVKNVDTNLIGENDKLMMKAIISNMYFSSEAELWETIQVYKIR